MLGDWVAAKDQTSLINLFDRIIGDTGYEPYINDQSDEGNDRWDNIQELRRLVGVQRAYNHMTAGDDCTAVADWACAEREYGAAEKLQPQNAEMAFWHAVALATNGRLEPARPLFKKAFDADPRWRELVKRLPAVDQLPKDPKLVEAILGIR